MWHSEDGKDCKRSPMVIMWQDTCVSGSDSCEVQGIKGKAILRGLSRGEFTSGLKVARVNTSLIRARVKDGLGSGVGATSSNHRRLWLYGLGAETDENNQQ